MAQAPGFCNYGGCYCKAYVVPTSKWSKGKCKTCNHAEKHHNPLQVDVTFEDTAAVAVPSGSSTSAYNAQIDNKMGIVPSGKTNYRSSVHPAQKQPQKPSASIYNISLDESDWINWSSNDLLIWFQQKKKFPAEINLQTIEHEMQSRNVNGMKVTQLTHSTLLSYGFTDYNHRDRVLSEIKSLLQQYPASTQNPKQNINANVHSNDAQKVNVQKQDDQKDAVKDKVDGDESVLLQNANLKESEWRTWSMDQVWEWIKIKQKWKVTEDMDYMMKHKLNGYEEKLKSDAVQLSGAKLLEVQQDMKTQKLLKGIGFPFSARKQVFKHIDALIRHNP